MSRAPDTTITKAFDATIDGDGGGFSGYANPFGKLDSVGDITMPGAFKDAIPGFLTHGFVPDNHEWERRLAYPVAAHEDAYGLFITARFHTTQRGQDARTEALERTAAGLSERLSIGFTLEQFEYVKGADAVQYLIDPTPEEIDRCASMARVRLIHKVKQLFEVSLVSVPAAAGSDVTEVKAGSPATGVVADAETGDTEAKGIHLGDMVEESASIFVIESLVQRLMWRVVYDVLYSGGDTPAAAKIDVLSEAMTEMHDEVVRIVGALLASKDEAAVEAAKADIAAIIELSTKADAAPRDRRANEQSVEVLAAVADHIRRERSICGLYLTKEGRRYSRATTDRLTTHRDVLRERADDIDAMLREGMPEDDEQLVIVGDKGLEPQSDTTTDAETETVTDDAGASPVYADPEIVNGIVAAFIIEHGVE